MECALTWRPIHSRAASGLQETLQLFPRLRRLQFRFAETVFGARLHRRPLVLRVVGDQHDGNAGEVRLVLDPGNDLHALAASIEQPIHEHQVKMLRSQHC